jgi:DNA repair photolyase
MAQSVILSEEKNLDSEITSATKLPRNNKNVTMIAKNLLVSAIQCRTALNLSKIPGMDYCLNPYVGCIHGCIYCYATFMKRFRNHPVESTLSRDPTREEWGSFVDVKINFAEVLRKEVSRKKVGMVAIGTVQDAYQPIEAKYCLTRQSIEILNEHNFPFEVLTKSSLVVRDIDLFKNNKDASVELTITTIDDRVRRIFEPRASSVLSRLQTLLKLLDNNIATTVFFGPVLPYFSDSPTEIRKFFALMQKMGVKRILVDKLNYLETKINRIIRAISNPYPKAIAYYRNIIRDQTVYKISLRQRIEEIAGDFKLTVGVLF